MPASTGHPVRGRTARGADLDVILLDGQYRQTLESARVYGESGLRVGIAACDTEARWAPSFHSRWCDASMSLPDFALDSPAYVDALLSVLEETHATMVLPAHDGSIQALRTRREDVERRAALPLATEQALDVATSKERTLSLGAQLGLRVPVDLPLGDLPDLRPALKAVGLPAVLKPVTSWVVDKAGSGVRLTSALVQTEYEAEQRLEAVLAAGGIASIQPWYRGSREAVTVFYAAGTFFAKFAQVSYREWPVLGGVSTLCESIPLLPDITTSAERLVEAIGLDGCSMVEFRRDREGLAVLMEVNPRMGGTVGLAERAGVSFPSLTHAWAMGEPLREVPGYRIGERLRWLIGDMWYLKKAFDREPSPEMRSAARTTVTLLSDFIARPSHLDGISFTDPLPGLAELSANLQQYLVPSLRKHLVGRRRPLRS